MIRYNQNMMKFLPWIITFVMQLWCTLWIGLFIERFDYSSLTDRTNNSKYGDTQANYILRVLMITFVQDIIRDIVQKRSIQKSDGYTMTDAKLKRAFEIYNEDMKKAENVILLTIFQLPML